MSEKFLPYGRQWLDDEDSAAVLDALQGELITQGSHVTAFETGLAEACESTHAVAVANGTAALHLAALAAGLGPEDEIITTPNTFVASANCARYCGAGVTFVDIEQGDLCLSATSLREELLQRSRTGRKLPKAVVNVLFAGNASNAKAIHDVAREFGMLVIEDACHALGARYSDDSKVGSCRFADMSVLSFHPVKHITTGEGGAVLTRNPDFARRLKSLRTHGIVRDGFEYAAGAEEPWYYEMQSLGFNYRITDIQCALGVTQLAKLGRFVSRRREIADLYCRKLAGLAGVVTPVVAPGHSFHLFVLRIDFDRLGLSRKIAMTRLREQDIGTQVHYIPVYRQPYYRHLYGLDPRNFPQTESYYRECLSIPMFPAMTDTDVERVIAALSGLAQR